MLCLVSYGSGLGFGSLTYLLYDKEFLIDLILTQHMLMAVYRIPYELVINGREVIIKAPFSSPLSCTCGFHANLP